MLLSRYYSIERLLGMDANCQSNIQCIYIHVLCMYIHNIHTHIQYISKAVGKIMVVNEIKVNIFFYFCVRFQDI